MKSAFFSSYFSQTSALVSHCMVLHLTNTTKEHRKEEIKSESAIESGRRSAEKAAGDKLALWCPAMFPWLSLDIVGSAYVNHE